MLCDACDHKHAVPYGHDLTCTAYPDGIPEAIRAGFFDHRKPYRGDHGVRFVMRPGREELLAYIDQRPSQSWPQELRLDPPTDV
jgi:hypothetical protein